MSTEDSFTTENVKASIIGESLWERVQLYNREDFEFA